MLPEHTQFILSMLILFVVRAEIPINFLYEYYFNSLFYLSEVQYGKIIHSSRCVINNTNS